MNDIMFSILVPAYKAAYLKECIDSILAQTYNNFELIIVDDASPEDLKAIVDKYDDSRIRYYRNETNFGAVNVVDNWNKCLSYAKGEYVICMGDDDMLLPSCLSLYMELISLYPNLYVYHGLTEIIDENGVLIDMQESRPLFEDVYSLIWHRWKGRKQYVGDFLYRTCYLQQADGFYKLPLAWGSDDITAVIMAKENGIANTQEPVFCYRKSSVTISNSGYTEIKLAAIANEFAWYEIFFDLPNKRRENDLDDMSRVYLDLCKKGMDKYFLKKRIHLLSEDMRLNFSRLFKWLRDSQKYGISKLFVLYSFNNAIRNYFSLKFQKRHF